MFIMDQEFKVKIRKKFRNPSSKYIKVRAPTKGFKIPHLSLTSKVQINHAVHIISLYYKQHNKKKGVFSTHWVSNGIYFLTNQ